ncbi:MAG: Holliday junction branch migration protein RuvA [Clostridia bacterium]|nr:Holliday junction branch migration protein RuvA [Clostridia bacterium]
MIYSLTGEILNVFPMTNQMVVGCGGVGYLLTVTTNTLQSLPVPNPSGDYEGKEIRVYTYLKVSEDAVDLFGFSSAEELECFKLLITVSGVGPKAAISILSLMTPEKLALAIAAEDIKAISRAQGVGGKTAARVVLELKEKIAKSFPTPAASAPTEKTRSGGPVFSSKLTDAQEALTVLGYSRQEAASVLKSADLSADLETIIRTALSKLMISGS